MHCSIMPNINVQFVPLCANVIGPNVIRPYGISPNGVGMNVNRNKCH